LRIAQPFFAGGIATAAGAPPGSGLGALDGILTTFLDEGGSFVAEDEAVRGDRRAASCRAVLFAKVLRRSGEVTVGLPVYSSGRTRLGCSRHFQRSTTNGSSTSAVRAARNDKR
jgi:hypothetical protein